MKRQVKEGRNDGKTEDGGKLLERSVAETQGIQFWGISGCRVEMGRPVLDMGKE